MPPPETARCLAGGGEMGALMRSFDWSSTSLGSPEQWQQSLKTAVRIMLTSRQPMFVWWGKDLINLYNDAYRDIVRGKHPNALGQPASSVWHEIWEQVGPRAESAILKNEGTYDEALLLIMERNGYPEETYYTFSYSPIPDDQGGTGGIICANTGDTKRIVGERQLALLRELAAKTADARTFDEACTSSVQCLQTNLYDFPFAMIYLLDSEQQQIVLAGTSGIDRGHTAAPETVDLHTDSAWSLAEVLKTHKVVLISELTSIYDSLPTGVWDRSPHQAVVVPIAPYGGTGKAGILVLGLNPFRLFNEEYQGFIDLVAAQITSSIANATAYEEERRRAEALAELDHAKTTFFSNVSHEFRTPLTLMLGPLEDMLATTAHKLDSQEQEQLKMVQRNGLRLQKLVNTLLDFSRLEAGRSQVVYVPTDLATLTSELASVFRSAIEQAGMTLQVNCPPLPEAVYVDRDMWEKIVLNLLSNAFKFTFTGEIEVQLEWRTEHVALLVRDTGTGIPAAELPHLFERFHRVEGTRGRSYEGSGIGLSLVQDLVKLHGGTISVNSVVGSGTCFTVRIPTGTAHLPPESLGTTQLFSTALGAIPYVEEALRWLPEANTSSGVQDGESSGRTEETTTELGVRGTEFNSSTSHAVPRTLHSALSTPHILLADDNADMRSYVKGLLTTQYEVTTVADGSEALAIARAQTPDLILSDVMMPTLNGLELVQHLRADPLTRGVPVILLSARAGEEARVEGLAVGADDYLVKPFSARELLARVEATLKLAQIRQSAANQEHDLRLISEAAKQEADAAYERISQILESMTDAFVALDCDWRVIYQNAESERINGRPKSETLGKTHWEAWSASIGTNVERQYRRAMAEQVPVHFEHHYFDPPNFDTWLEIHAYPSAQGLGVFYRDITDRKRVEAERQQSEKALKQSEEKFRQLANAMPQIVWTTNAVGELDYVSDQWADYTGLTLEQTRGLSQENLFMHPDDVQTSLEQWQAALATETPYQAEFRLRRASDGVYHWYLGRAMPIRNEEGQVIRWYGTSTDINVQKLIELELQQANDRFELAAKAVRGLIYDVDIQTNFVARTEGLIRVLGYSLAEAEPTLDWWDRQIHVDDLQRSRAEGQAQMDQSDRYRVEYRIRHQQGHYVHVQDQGLLIRNAAGVPMRIVGSTIDISEVKRDEVIRKEIEEALRHSERRYRSLIEATSQIIWDTSAEGEFVSEQPGWSAFTGQTFDELKGWGWLNAIHPEDRANTAQVWTRAVTHQIVYEVEHRLQRHNGVYRNMRVKAVPVFEEDGTLREWIGVHVDITKAKRDEVNRNQAETALRQSEERYRYLVESIPQLVWTANTDGVLLDVNQRWLDFTGLSLAQVQTEGWQVIIHPEDIAQLSECWQSAQQSGDRYQAEGRMRRADGEYRWHLHQAVAGKDELGQVVKWFGTATDIEDQKQLDHERDQILQQEHHARAQAEHANRMKDEFLAVLSHELRTPLNPILGWAKLLRTGKVSADKYEAAFETIERNAKLQTQLIEDLLDISRILQGKLALSIYPVDLTFMITAARETVRLAADAKRITIHTVFEPNVGTVAGDTTRLQQVVWNLLSNAIKFTPEGGRIDIRLKQVKGEKIRSHESRNRGETSRSPLTSYAQITIRDTGKGISSDFLPHVFDYFRQADGATTRQFGGLGLGLAIVRQVVDLHGGKVFAESPGEGQGATFTVQLPLLHQTAPADEDNGPSILTFKSRSLTGLKILVVDDDADSLDFAAFILQQDGGDVITVASALEAIEVLKQSHIDVLVSDVGMPEMDGYMLIRYLKTQGPQESQIPAIALTAYAGESDHQQIIEAGFKAHVTKPVEPEQLITAIVNSLTR
ncbi:PAS domain S-box protein [Phormidium sp. CLA17]|nr:PAS domain S-box protein [Leptolyngbya sp. Cla-17]